MRRLFSDAVISAAILLVVLAGLVMFDPRVREHVAAIAASAPSTPAGARSELADVTSAIVSAARNQSIEHAPMMIFVVVASVLFVAMFRS